MSFSFLYNTKRTNRGGNHTMTKRDKLNNYINTHKEEIVEYLVRQDLRFYSTNELIETFNLPLDYSKEDIKNYLREQYNNRDLVPICEQYESIYRKVLRENRLVEGTDYRKQAIKILVDSGMFTEATATKIIDGLYRQDIHAFNHAPAWLEKYLKGIARMIVEECEGNIYNVQSILTECPNVFNQYLYWVLENRDKVGTQIDNEFIQKMSYQDVKDKIEEIQAQRDAQSKDELSKMDFSKSSHYSLVPIDSYEQVHNLYGGNATGDGDDLEGYYAGNGGTAWCHTNSQNTYNNWIGNGNKFFVLQRDNWKDIPFNEEDNDRYNGKDDYGNSLIAILVDKYGKLKNATLRCNHVGVPMKADNQYDTYADLSKVVGFNVEEEVQKNLPEIEEPKDEVIEIFGKKCRIRHLVIDGEEQPDWYDFIDLPMLSRVYSNLKQASELRDPEGNASGLCGRQGNLLDGGPGVGLHGGCLQKIKDELSKYFTVVSIHLWDTVTIKAMYPDPSDRIKYWQGEPCEYWLFNALPQSCYRWYEVDENGAIGLEAVNEALGVSCIFQIKI